MILPPHRPVSYVDPKPMCDGVYERNERLCIFWGAPSVPTSYAFALGKLTDSLAQNAQRWRRRTRNFRPTSRKQVLVGLAIGLAISALIAVLIEVYGQAAAAAWAGTGTGAVTLLLTIVGLLAVRQPNSGGLSNPA